MSAILEITGVSKTYDADSDNPLKALDGVDLTVEEGEFVCIIGPSGCGKSTLFNIVGGLIADYEGTVLIDSHPVDGAHKELLRIGARRCHVPISHPERVIFSIRQPSGRALA